MALTPCIGFDLGDTLLEYAGVPLNWESHYAEALERLARAAGVQPSPPEIAAAADIVRMYNTRLHPRTAEVGFETIAQAILRSWKASSVPVDAAAAEAFFGVFQQRLRPFPDAAPALVALRASGRRIGVFTDVPYGMPRALVERDVATAGLMPHVDALLTSRDVGHRKPAALALAGLAEALGTTAEQLTYVGNEPKDVAAARAFGCRSVLVVRSGAAPACGQDCTVRSLLELSA